MNDVSEVFSVGDEYPQILATLYAGLQRTALWRKARGSCFCAAGFVSMAFNALGRQTRILPCHVVAVRDNTKFTLGHKGLIAVPGQEYGHAVCLVEEKILVDFGLNNIRSYCWPDFPRAAALEVSPGNVFPSELAVDKRRKIFWCNDWVNPATEAIMAEEKPMFELLYDQYRIAISSRHD